MAIAAVLALAGPAAAQQSTGGVGAEPGTSGASGDRPMSAPTSSPPPPGIVVRPSPQLRSWRCVRRCQDARTATTGSLLRLRGRALERAYEVVFLGASGAGDDIAAAPLRRSGRRVDVRVPLGAAAGPVLVADRDGLESAPSAQALAVGPPSTLKAAGAAPTVEVQTQARRAFFDTALAARVHYVVHGDSPANVVVELVRPRDGAVMRRWEVGEVEPEARHTLRWNGLARGGVLRPGSYAFRVTAVSPSGLRAESAAVPREGDEPDPAAVRFLRHQFPVRGPHYFGEYAARFGGGRGHQGQDVFAACGTPLVAARGGVVKVKQYHSRAGHYLVIDGHRTSTDYAYMHLRDAALVRVGQRVRTGRLLGYVGQTGRASGCHLHFEMWTGPGWYEGGTAFDPLPPLLSWDRSS